VKILQKVLGGLLFLTHTVEFLRLMSRRDSLLAFVSLLANANDATI